MNAPTLSTLTPEQVEQIAATSERWKNEQARDRFREAVTNYRAAALALALATVRLTLAEEQDPSS
jgi:hypothetical protein